jgi:hypothetical protein
MPAHCQLAARTRRPPPDPSHQAATKRNPKVAAAQTAAALRELAARGVLTGRADKVSARIDHGLLQAAARKIGSTNTTEVVQAALAAFVAPDPFVEWLLSDKDRLPADFELAI